jgi:bifunctional DNA-binding transcriptional regulator/antitoxin component of YhaV-PrlF toxin-antitoxin module
MNKKIKTKNMEKHERKLIKVSTHSYSVVIPKSIIEKYGWQEKQKLVITDKGRGKIEIRDWRKK